MPRPVPMVTITLDRERSLRLDLNAIVEFEEAAGKRLAEIGNHPTPRDIRILLWACLLDEDPDLTIRDVGRMVHPGSIQDITDAIGVAYGGAMPDPEPGNGTLKNRRTRSTGSRSGRSADTTFVSPSGSSGD